MNEINGFFGSTAQCPASIQKTTAFVGTRDSERSLLMNCLQKETPNTMCCTDLQTAAAMRVYSSVKERKICICGLGSGWFANRREHRGNPPPVSGWCMRMWLRVNAWTRTQLQRNKTRVTHTHTHTVLRVLQWLTSCA